MESYIMKQNLSAKLFPILVAGGRRLSHITNIWAVGRRIPYTLYILFLTSLNYYLVEA